MNTAASCRKCGCPVTVDTRGGICPKCLFNLAGANAAQVESADTLVLAPDSPSDESQIANRKSQIKNTEAVLHSFGDYELLEEIARGGMGVVYKARQKSLDRLVAVKLILAGQFAGKQVAQRFKSEAIAAAVLHHPNIVAVHEVGVHEGHHFFSMDYVEGRNLSELVAQRPLPPRDAARYVKLIAEAIHYAHGQGILHRDLKPSNVLIDAATDQPRLTDFGLAKRFDGKTSLTVSGQLLGSPHFMPPEQAGSGRGKVGRASDVFGLGGILYFLLTARAPFQGETIEATIDQALHAEPASLRLLNPAVLRDLETLCLKCLEKEPGRRYQTAEEVVEELERFLVGEPILARPISPVERAWRWCVRRPAVAAFATATILLLLAVVIGSPIAAWRIAAARDAERRERQWAEQNADELLKSLYVADMRAAHQALQDENMALAQELVNKYLPALGLPSDASPSAPLNRSDSLPVRVLSRELLGWEWRHLWLKCQTHESYTLGGFSKGVACVAVSPDGRLLACASDRSVRVTDFHSRQIVAHLTGFNGPIDSGAMAFSPDGKLLAAKGGTIIRLWEVDRWEKPQEFQGMSDMSVANSLVFSPDGNDFVTRVKGGLGIWSRSPGSTTWRKEVLAAHGAFGAVLSHSRDGQWLAVSDGGNLQLRNARSITDPNQLRILERRGEWWTYIVAIAFSNQYVAVGHRDGEVILWEIGTWREVGRIHPHPSFVVGLAFSPDGRLLATGGSDLLVKLWDVESLTTGSGAAEAEPVNRLRGHLSSINGLAFTPEGKALISASKDGTVKMWTTLAEEADRTFESERLLWLSIDGRRMITRDRDQLRLWDTVQQRSLGLVGPDVGLSNVKGMTASSDGQLLALGTAGGVIEIWDFQRNELQRRLLAENDRNPVVHLAFTKDKRSLASATDRGSGTDGQITLRTWDLLSGQIQRAFTNAFGPLEYSSDGEHLVYSRLDGNVVSWNLGDHSGVTVEEDFAWKGSLALSPDGRLLATGSEEPNVRLWDTLAGTQLFSLKGSKMCIEGVAFAPDGKTLVSGTVDGEIKFWNVTTGKELFTLEQFAPRGGTPLLFSGNGEYLALTQESAAGRERRVELWHAPSFEEIIAAEKAKARKK